MANWYECPPRGFFESCADYCGRAGSSCCTCQLATVSRKSGTGVGKKKYLDLALVADPYAVLNDHPYLAEPFIAEVLPLIASGEALAEAEQFAEEMYGIGHSDKRLDLPNLSRAFAKLRGSIRQTVADHASAQSSDTDKLASSLITAVAELVPVRVEPLDMLRNGLLATDHPLVGLGFARELKAKAPADPPDVREAQLLFVSDVYQKVVSLSNTNEPYERQIAKLALAERAEVVVEIGRLRVDQGQIPDAQPYEAAAERLKVYADQLA